MAIRNLMSLLFSKTSYIAYPRLYFHSYAISVSCKIAKEARLYSSNLLCSYCFATTDRKLSKYAVENVNGKVNDAFKIKLIMGLNLQSDIDALPFYKLPIKTLQHIHKTTKKDEESGYCKNRLYYIADRIKCPPFVLSQRIVRRTFIYSLSFNWLENSLNVLLDMDVRGDRILRDLWVLKYHHKTIQERLQRVKNTGVDTLYPWMVRCSEDILNRSIQIFQETKSILGENKSTKMYLANRLNISPEIIEDMFLKVPALKTTRAAKRLHITILDGATGEIQPGYNSCLEEDLPIVKVKNFLDFLLEQGFSPEDITNKARILTASQNTVKQRLEKLRVLGLQEINLNVLCRSRKDFQKYCESIETVTKDLS